MIENVQIDAVIYRVEETDEALIIDGRECGASVDYNLGLIRIRNDKAVGRGARAKFLMHEILHAVLHERGMFEASENEELIDALAAGLVNLARENPRLVSFMMGGDCNVTDTRGDKEDTVGCT